MNEYDQIFLSVLGSKEKLLEYIENDIDMIKQVNLNHKKILTMFKTIASVLNKEKEIKSYLKKVNPTYVLNLLEENKPELFDTIVEHPRGLFWIRKQRFDKLLEL